MTEVDRKGALRSTLIQREWSGQPHPVYTASALILLSGIFLSPKERRKKSLLLIHKAPNAIPILRMKERHLQSLFNSDYLCSWSKHFYPSYFKAKETQIQDWIRNISVTTWSMCWKESQKTEWYWESREFNGKGTPWYSYCLLLSLHSSLCKKYSLCLNLSVSRKKKKDEGDGSRSGKQESVGLSYAVIRDGSTQEPLAPLHILFCS